MLRLEGARELLDAWLAPAYCTSCARADMQEWWAQGGRRPFQIRDLLRPDKAEQLGRLIARASFLRYEHMLLRSESPLVVDEDEFERSPLGERFLRHWVGTLSTLFAHKSELGPDEGDLLAEFVAFFYAGFPFRGWLSDALGMPVMEPNTLEFARYGRGDFIGEHKDVHDTRIIALNLYLDSRWRDGQGGELGYRDGDGRRFITPPTFASAALFGVAPDCAHWVQARTVDEVGRMTVSVSYRSGADPGQR